MASRHTLFRIFYRIGFTPWEGHSLGQALRDLVEGTGDTAALPTGSALDLGCGTGDSSIYLAQHGWKVTGVDFVAKPLDKARVKADAAKVSIDFVHADVTNLSQAGIGADFQLIIDNGCLHAMSDRDRDAYVRETSALAAPDAHLVIEAFIPGGRFGVPGVDVRSPRDQKCGDLRVAAPGRFVQWGAAQRVAGVHTNSRVNQPFDVVQAPGMNRFIKLVGGRGLGRGICACAPQGHRASHHQPKRRHRDPHAHQRIIGFSAGFSGRVLRSP